MTRTTLPEGNAVEYAYDANHNITKETLLPKPGASESPIITQYTYEAPFNRVKTVTDPLGRTTTFNYDGKGNPVRIDLPQVDGKVPKITMTYNSRSQVKTVTDPEGMKTGRTYDAKTADLRSVIVDQGRLGLRSRFVYDAVGNLTRLTDPLNRTRIFKYNSSNGRSEEVLGEDTSTGGCSISGENRSAPAFRAALFQGKNPMVSGPRHHSSDSGANAAAEAN